MKTIDVKLGMKAYIEQTIAVDVDDNATFDDAVRLLLKNEMWHNEVWKIVDYTDSMPSIIREV